MTKKLKAYYEKEKYLTLILLPANIICYISPYFLSWEPIFLLSYLAPFIAFHTLDFSLLSFSECHHLHPILTFPFLDLVKNIFDLQFNSHSFALREWMTKPPPGFIHS